MSEKMKQFEFKEGEWVVTGWAEGQMETEREDDRGNKVTVMRRIISFLSCRLAAPSSPKITVPAA